MAKQDDWVRMTLRLPQDLHDRLMGALGAKSLNADIVERLERDLSGDVFCLRGEPSTARFVLDTDGAPISWDEIREHIHAITQAFPRGISAMSVDVLTPQVLSSRGRQEEADALAAAYLKMRKSRPKQAAIWDRERDED